MADSFHIPLHSPDGGGLPVREGTLMVCCGNEKDPALCTHLEMETTRGVLPAEMKNREVVDQLVGEYEWTQEQLRRTIWHELGARIIGARKSEQFAHYLEQLLVLLLIGVGYMGIEPIDWRMIAWVGFGATALYLGGMYLNDASDVAFDQKHRKERPIPSGAISESVWKIGIGLLAVGMGALSIQGGATALLALGLFNCILIYNFAKTEVVPASNRALPVVIDHDGGGVCLCHDQAGDEFFGDSNSGMAAWVASVLCLYVVG